MKMNKFSFNFACTPIAAQIDACAVAGRQNLVAHVVSYRADSAPSRPAQTGASRVMG